MTRKHILCSFLLLAACQPVTELETAIRAPDGSTSTVQEFPETQAQTMQAAKDIQTNVTRNVERVSQAVRVRVHKNANAARDWWIAPLPDDSPQTVQASYCYHVMQDIVCYRDPQPGMEARLFGLQGEGAEPQVVRTKMLPLRARDDSQLPQNRAATAEPQFVGVAPTPKAVAEEAAEEAKKQTGATAVIDPTKEQLPNPTTTPQL